MPYKGINTSAYSVECVCLQARDAHLDESGSDKRDYLRKYACSLCGKPPVCHELLARGEHVSVIAFTSMAEVLDCQIAHGSVNGEVFYDLLRQLFYHIYCHSTRGRWESSCSGSGGPAGMSSKPCQSQESNQGSDT